MNESIWKRWFDSPGFWMALFSLTGLILLTVAGPGIERRMTQRMQQVPSTAPTQDSARQRGEGSEPDAEPAARSYSVSPLRWLLGIGVIAGLLWSMRACWPKALDTDDGTTA